MQKIILYISIALLTLVNTVCAQKKKPESFSVQIEKVGYQIEFLSYQKKLELKQKIDSLETLHKNNKISLQEFETLKLKEAEKTAKFIETNLNNYRTQIDTIIQNKLNDENTKIRHKTDTIDGKEVIKYYNDNDYVEYNVPALKFYKSKKEKEERLSRRTTSQVVFAAGYNNLVTNNMVANSQFGYGRSGFWEWGVTWNTRLSNNSNLLHLKYGAGFMYNSLHATDNRVFADINNQTVLVDAGVETKAKRTYFKNVYFVVPMHLEFDFSKTKIVDDKKVFKSHTGARFGIGGFVGVNTNSKQFIEYEQNGYKFKEKQKGDFNVNDFTYGVSTYIGYRATSLYLKYDLNPIFKNNPVDQNNISLGIRFDWN